MRAYIDYGKDQDHTSDTAYVCETRDGVHTGTYEEFPMPDKQYYIEYELDEHPDGEMMLDKEPRDLVKVPVDITALTNEQVVELITALNDAGFEAVLRSGVTPFLDNEKWYPKTYPVYPNTIPNPLSPYVQPYTINYAGENYGGFLQHRGEPDS